MATERTKINKEFSKDNRISKEVEDRLHHPGKRIGDFCLKLKWDIINTEYTRPLIRPNGSVGANYIEASDDLGLLDEKMKFKIVRREAKETIHWLDLILTYENRGLEEERIALTNEADQIKKYYWLL